MKFSVLASGSSGNCVYVEDDTAAILVDAGISCKQIIDRLNEIGGNIDKLKGIFVTHEHVDHIRGIDVLSRKLDIPVYCSKKMEDVLMFDNIKVFKEINKLGDLKIVPFSKSHDAVDPHSFIIEEHKKKLGVITDTGYVCENTANALKQLNSAVFEANHDLNMLRAGPYPYFLKQRIESDRGHLSNEDAALAVLQNANPMLKDVFLAHLSDNNNTPELALKTFKAIVNHRKDLDINFELTDRYKATDLREV